MSENKKNKTIISTRVDLGEDLLSEPEEHFSSVHSVMDEENPKELLRSAKILKSEGLIAEAKKAFLKVLRFDPKNSQAKKLLEEIQDYEFNKIFEESDSDFSISIKEDYQSPDQIFKKLEEDLNIDLKTQDLSHTEKLKIIETEILNTDRTFNQYYDLALLFYQIDFFSKSLEYLEKIILKSPESDPELESTFMVKLSALELKAVILDEQNLYFDLMQFIEKEFINKYEERMNAFENQYDPSHFFYLMAKACYSTKRHDEAQLYLDRIAHLKTSFKDIKTLRKNILQSESKKTENSRKN